MAEQIYIGNFAKGLINSRLPFNIDNDAFPTMQNFYSWRGRAKRKRGTQFVGQLSRQIQLAAMPNNWQYAQLTLSSDQVNLITALGLGSGSTITPGSINLTVGANTYTDPPIQTGALTGTPGGSGNIDYATGLLTITGGGASNVTGTFSYYPGLPVMGLRDLLLPVTGSVLSQYPQLLAFDTTYAYQYNQNVNPNSFYSVSYYKGTDNPVIWSAPDSSLFWTTNYSGALWATNNKPGFHFVNATYISGSGTTMITFNFKSGGVNVTNLVVGDQIWFNEWSGSTINGLVGTVTDVTGSASGNYIVTFTSVVTVVGTGIGQLLTNSIAGQDGIRWYDGDMTNGTGLPTSTLTGWANFAPPLTATTVSIDNQTTGLYYLVGALAILPFKDRLLFFSPWIQTSSGATPIQLSDTILWSWNGTPYYDSVTPTGETFSTTAYYVDQTGLGGYLPAGISQSLTTITNNEDALLVGFTGRQTRFEYTGNDLQPFLFYNINSQLGSSSTFSGVTLDRGGITFGSYGIIMTDQQSAQRIDLDIPNNVFQIQAANSGAKRVNAVRDFYREWIYFSYPVGTGNTVNFSWKYPTQTLFFNYRDNTWAIFRENFTAHGNFRPSNSFTWATSRTRYPTWVSWRDSWASGTSFSQFPAIIGGTPQGYVLIKGEGTGEAPSLTIQSIASNGTDTQITSNNHCVSLGDYLYVNNTIGLASTFNGSVGRVRIIIDANNFVLDIPFPTGTYMGLGLLTKLSQPLLQTKQFPFYWNEGRQTRLSVQRYLLDYTANGQATININLSQNPTDIWNDGSIVPATEPDPTNNALIYSQVIYTSPEPYFQSCYNSSLGNVGNGASLTFSFNYPTLFGYTGSFGANLVPGSITITVGNVATFSDASTTSLSGLGNFTSVTGTATTSGSSIDYNSGVIVIAFTSAPTSQPTTTNFQYPTNNIQMPIASASQRQIWHRYSTSLQGDSVQIGLTLNDPQMRDYINATSELTLHGIQLTIDKGPMVS